MSERKGEIISQLEFLRGQKFTLKFRSIINQASPMSRRSNTKDCRKSLIIMVTMQTVRRRLMNEKLFIRNTYHRKPSGYYIVFGKIRTRNFPPRSPPSKSSFFTEQYFFHVFSGKRRDHVIVFILLRCLPLNSAFVFFEKKTALSSGFLLLF